MDNKSKKIVIISWYGESETGGVEFVTYYLHQIWGELYDVEIIDFNKVKNNNLYSFFVGKHYVLDALLVSMYANKYIRELKRCVGDENVIVVTQGYNAPNVRADIAFAHGTMRGFEINAFNNYAWDYYERFEKKSWSYARKIIAVGEHVKIEAHKYYGIDLNKIEVIQNCVDTSIFFPKPRNEHKGCNIIYCGRLTPPKNPQKLLEFARFIENNSSIKLIIATPSAENTEQFEQLKNTEIHIGLKKNEMNNFYNKGDIMYFPSVYEGFGLVTAECLSAGVPVFGNEVGAVNDFHKAGRMGIGIISGDNQRDLFEMIKLSKQYHDMDERKKLHEQMLKYQSFDVYKDKLINVLEEVMGNVRNECKK